jgi:predicted permease
MGPLPLELVPCLVMGLAAGRRWPRLAAVIVPVLIRWAVPLALVGMVLRTPLNGSLLVSALVALLVCGGGLGLLLAPGPWRRRMPSGPLALGMVVGNTAYWGLPVTAALLPAAALPHAITYDLVGTLLTWSVGPLILAPGRSGSGTTATRLTRLLITSPAAQGLLIALPLQASPWSQVLADLLWLPARLLMLLALGLVGMRLGSLMEAPGRPNPAGAGLPLALLGKLVLLPALVLVLGLGLGLAPSLQAALVLQAGAPTAVSVLLLAEAHGNQVEQAAALVIWSTGLALVTVPIWAALLERLPLAAALGSTVA